MVQHHKYSISEVESLTPFERDLYVVMISNYVKEQEEARRLAQG